MDETKEQATGILQFHTRYHKVSTKKELRFNRRKMRLDRTQKLIDGHDEIQDKRTELKSHLRVSIHLVTGIII